MDIEQAALENGWARRTSDGGLIWSEHEICPSEVWDVAVAVERARWRDVEQYLIAAADGSMSRNNSENLAAELLAQIRA